MFIGQRSTMVNLVMMIKMIDLMNMSLTTMLIQRMVMVNQMILQYKRALKEDKDFFGNFAHYEMNFMF